MGLVFYLMATMMHGIGWIDCKLSTGGVHAWSRGLTFVSSKHNIRKLYHTDRLRSKGVMTRMMFLMKNQQLQYIHYDYTARNAMYYVCLNAYSNINSNDIQNKTFTTGKCDETSNESIETKLQKSPDMKVILQKKDPPKPNFCSHCGSSNIILDQPLNDPKIRAVCQDCQTITYTNPKIVVSCVILSSCMEYCLLAKRNIMPQKGKWGIPQGYMELYESTRDATIREVYEEIGLNINDKSHLQLRAIYNIPGSVQLVYEIRCFTRSILQEHAKEINDMISKYHSSSQGEELNSISAFRNKDKMIVEETAEVQLFSIDTIPYDDICFPTVQWAIDHCRTSSPSTIQHRSKIYDPNENRWLVIDDD
jgi:NADH pyrophosphatase NudC (nudix superfamily)